MGSTRKLPNPALSRDLVPRPPQPHLQQPISRLLSLTKPTVPPPEKRVMEKAAMYPPLGHHPRQLLVVKMVKPVNQPAADSPLQPPPLPPLGGGACMQALSGECEVAGSIRRQWNQQRACHFRNLCETTHRIQLIDEFGTRRYIKQQG
jgi:hypothetical protein